MSRQRFGQHFLTSPHILKRIATAACGDHIGTVVEIGPGRGALTEHLLQRANRVVAIEIDPEMIGALAARFPSEPKLKILKGNALEQDFGVWAPDTICGNLPYYAATAILVQAVRSGIRTVGLIQKEVAERIVAKPGSKDYGYLTCDVALFADARLLFQVKPGAFRPPPKVDSAVIALEPNARAAALEVSVEPFQRFLSACFRHKRKTLRNNLSGVYEREILSRLPQASNRAEECSLQDLAALFRSLSQPLRQQ